MKQTFKFLIILFPFLTFLNGKCQDKLHLLDTSWNSTSLITLPYYFDKLSNLNKDTSNYNHIDYNWIERLIILNDGKQGIKYSDTSFINFKIIGKILVKEKFRAILLLVENRKKNEKDCYLCVFDSNANLCGFDVLITEQFPNYLYKGHLSSSFAIHKNYCFYSYNYYRSDTDQLINHELVSYGEIDTISGQINSYVDFEDGQEYCGCRRENEMPKNKKFTLINFDSIFYKNYDGFIPLQGNSIYSNGDTSCKINQSYFLGSFMLANKNCLYVFMNEVNVIDQIKKLEVIIVILNSRGKLTSSSQLSEIKYNSGRIETLTKGQIIVIGDSLHVKFTRDKNNEKIYLLDTL